MAKMRRNRISWDTLKLRVRDGNLTPILGDRVGHDGFLTSESLIQEWARKVNYPFPRARSITRVAQFLSVTEDARGAKEKYLEFLKRHLLANKRIQGEETEEFMDTLERELIDLNFSQVASRLKYPDFGMDYSNPLKVLAQLNLPIYITTNYHPFMAQALEQNNKTPRIEVCPWNRTDEIVTDDDKTLGIDPQNPVVYHLHGLDRDPSSLVLTEDDYLDFLVAVIQDNEVIHHRIRRALSSTTLLLLGYELQDWDFRVLFRGLIKERPPSRIETKSICIQLNPEIDDIGSVLCPIRGRQKFAY